MVKKTLKPITLKEFAAILELSQSTVSRIINGAGGAHRIAEETQQRVLHAAALYGYTANSVARSLRQKRSYTIGVIVPEISDGYSTAVLSGIEDELLKDGFFYFVVSHRHRAELLEGYPRMMLARSVEGIIAVDSPIEEELPVPLVFLANVGEEGEGDLRGVRHFYQHSPLAGRVAAHIVLDGAGADTAVTQALGSRRYQVTVTGPGGHSFTDAGMPNPIAALASALAVLDTTPLPPQPRTTLNLGTISGGTSVNSIPESAQAAVDFRSTDPAQLVRLEVALHRAVEDAVDRANARARTASPHPAGHLANARLAYVIEKIGDRPAAALPASSPLLDSLRAVDRHLGLPGELRLGSTDANLPLSLGIPALSMGAGGEGGGAHTLAEWYSARNRELGLKRVLLLTLAMLDWASEQ